MSHQRDASLQRSVLGGARMVALSQAASQCIALVVLSCLYRALGGGPFGLLGMAAPLMAFAELIGSFGLPVAAVQRERLDAEHLSALFWTNVALSLAASATIAMAAFPLARLYSVPELAPFCAALSLAPLASSLVRIHRALLQRRLWFGRMAVVRIAAQLAAGGSAIAAAAYGWGVWALALQIYVDQLVLALALWLIEPWRPTRPRWGSVEVGELLQFSGLYSLSSLLFFVAQHVDRIALSWWIGASPGGQEAIGFYSQAHGLMTRPLNQLGTPITTLMLPALSQARGEERSALIVDFFRAVGVLLFPAGAGLAVIAPDVMMVMGGASWEPAGRLLRVIAPVLMIHGLLNICGSVCAACNRAGLLARLSSGFALLTTAAILAGAALGATKAAPPNHLAVTMGVALGLAAAHWLWTPLHVSACLKAAGASRRRVAAALAPGLLAAVLMGVVVAASRQAMIEFSVNASWRAGALIGIGAVCYVAAARNDIVWLVRRWLLGIESNVPVGNT